MVDVGALEHGDMIGEQLRVGSIGNATFESATHQDKDFPDYRRNAIARHRVVRLAGFNERVRVTIDFLASAVCITAMLEGVEQPLDASTAGPQHFEARQRVTSHGWDGAARSSCHIVQCVRRWRIPDGDVLVETQESEAQFYRLDPTGAVKRIYRAQSCSTEEELHKTTYEIIGSRMVERHSLDIPFEQTKESIADELSGLSELPPGESPTFAEVKSAIATHHGSVAKVEGRRATEIAALVQMHPVASSAMRAQIPALANRIVRYQDEECERILDCVDRLHDLHVSLEDRPKTFVNRTAKLLADACALITFKVDSYTSPATPHRTAHGDTPCAVTIPLFESLQRERERVIAQASQAPFAQMIAVVDAWDRAQRGLLQAEDVQSYIDARSTALAYAKAAGLMAAAAECLALGFAGVTLL